MSNSGKEALSARGAQPDDELSLFDLVAFFRRHRVASLSGAVIGGVLGLAIAFSLPVQWEAVALLQVAQLGGVGLEEPSRPVETPLRVVERVKQKSFGEDVEKRMGILPGEAKVEAGIMLDSLMAKVEKSDLVGVYVRGTTPAAATRFAGAVVAELASVHAKMAEPTTERWREELYEVEMELKRASVEAEQLSALLGKQGRSIDGNNLYRAMLASNILLARENNLRGFQERKRVLQEQLSPARTFPTSPLGRIEISKRPVFPKKSRFAAAGLAIGLLLGVSTSVLRHAGVRRSA